MELVFERDELLYSLQLVQGVASGRNTLPILSNVLIRAEEGNIEFSATDLEVGIKIKVLELSGKREALRFLPKNWRISLRNCRTNRLTSLQPQTTGLN